MRDAAACFYRTSISTAVYVCAPHHHYYSKSLPHWNLKCHNLLHLQSVLNVFSLSLAMDSLPLHLSRDTEVDCVRKRCTTVGSVHARELASRARASPLPRLIQRGTSRLMRRERCAASRASGKRFFTADMTKKRNLFLLLLHLFNLIPSTHGPSTLPRLTRHRISCIPRRDGDLFFNCNGTNNSYYVEGERWVGWGGGTARVFQPLHPHLLGRDAIP